MGFVSSYIGFQVGLFCLAENGNSIFLPGVDVAPRQQGDPEEKMRTNDCIFVEPEIISGEQVAVHLN
ncbi:hypothetical protein [Rhizobium sp.]|jgi:hypothetical protein|uniref:hypothetical protein n=1 Tax=Rhizobium sp. TaxID=391 RepID=UPI002AA869D7